jgi:hypothetical protein
MRSLAAATALLLVVVGLASRPAGALDVGDAAPAFDLPWLAEPGGTRAPECFAGMPATVLLIWDRGCPHCLELALSSSTLADSIEPLGARVLGIALGPDDPEVIRDLLWERKVLVPNLWDRERRTAGAYDLGIKHIGIFVVDRSGVIRARFDDEMSDLVATVKPAVLNVIDQGKTRTTHQSSPLPPINGVAASPGSARLPAWPTPRIDGRCRLMGTDGARSGDTGLFGEALENGTLWLYRWDMRLAWDLNKRIVIEPWLRVSNESEAVLTEGAEQLTNPRGSMSLRYNDRYLSASLGAYRLRLSPLSLQRWDLDDVPPIGGGSGGVSCACGGGALGLQQRSLEILGTDYTFEGASASMRYSRALARGWIAIPRWEDRGNSLLLLEEREARYRRIVYGGSIDLGKAGTEERVFDLPTPLGLRAGILMLEDDKRTLETFGSDRPLERDERVAFALGTLGPWQGLSADCEYADLRADGTDESRGVGFRGGLRGSRSIGRAVLWGRIHWIRIDKGFDPFYRALTYEANREGWRGALGVRLFPSGGGTRERLGLTFFLRSLRKRTSATEASGGSQEWTTLSASLSARPIPGLLTEAHWVLLRMEKGPPGARDAETSGASFDARWEGLGSLEPVLRVEAIRPEPGDLGTVTVWQTYCFARVLK